jgi:hypothetical protein
MTVGTVFTLFIVPVFYSLIAATHQPSSEEDTEQERLPINGTGRAHDRIPVGAGVR